MRDQVVIAPIVERRREVIAWYTAVTVNTVVSYQTFLAVAVFTMLLTPFLLQGGPALIDRLAQLVPMDRLLPGFRPTGITAGEQPLADHVIIAGYGLNGRNLSAALRSIAAQLPCRARRNRSPHSADPVAAPPQADS